MTNEIPRDAESLIPHRGPMCLVERLAECGDGAAVVEAVLRPDGALVDEGGRAEPAGLLELMAQACAAMRGYEDRAAQGSVRSGFLVGVRAFRVAAEARAGDRLQIRVRTVGTLEGFTVADAEVLRGGDLVATGTLKLWVTDEPPARQGRGTPEGGP